MVIKVGRDFLKKTCKCVLTDLEVPKKDHQWYVEQFEDLYVTDEGEFVLGDGDKGYFIEYMEELTIAGYDEFDIEVVKGRDIVVSLDSGDEDGEQLEDGFYDFIYEAIEKFVDDNGLGLDA